LAFIVVVVAAAVLGLPASGAVAAKPAQAGTEIRDLYYGEVLFHFYQQDEFTALTHLLVARQNGTVSHHAAEAELLLGGLYLSYGQHRQAGEIFDRLLDETADPAVRSRAWFYLGKVRYQRGLFAAAEQAFAEVDADLPGFLDAEYHMLLAQSLMGQDRYSDAAQVLDSWQGREDWLAYARYNLGVALVRMGRLEDGAGLLERVGELETRDAEILALRDQANLALGYSYLQSGQAGSARTALERVRLQGPFSNKALLGVGWADALQQDYRNALNPWLELQDRDLLDSAVQESLLAVPYAFSQLDADGSAAEFYLAALNQFDTEILRLDSAIRRTDAGELIPALLDKDETEIGRWHWQLQSVPASEDSRYLYHLVANHEFQNGLRNYRDLIALRDHLEKWRDKLGAFDDMVATGTQAYAQRMPQVEDGLAQIDLSALHARRDELATRLATIERSRDVVGLATKREADLWHELEILESSAAWDMNESAGARDKHRILKGVLLWDMERDYKFRLWQQRRSLTELDQALMLAESHQERIQAAGATVPERLQEFAHRIDGLEPRIDAMQGQITAALGRQGRSLQVLASRELNTQKERLATYRLQARFALATVYDHVSVATTDDAGAGK